MVHDSGDAGCGVNRVLLGDGYVEVDIDENDPDEQYLVLWTEVGPLRDIMKVRMSRSDAFELSALLEAKRDELSR